VYVAFWQIFHGIPIRLLNLLKIILIHLITFNVISLQPILFEVFLLFKQNNCKPNENRHLTLELKLYWGHVKEVIKYCNVASINWNFDM
jgi:hypothetical protein